MPRLVTAPLSSESFRCPDLRYLFMLSSRLECQIGRCMAIFLPEGATPKFRSMNRNGDLQDSLEAAYRALGSEISDTHCDQR